MSCHSSLHHQQPSLVSHFLPSSLQLTCSNAVMVSQLNKHVLSRVFMKCMRFMHGNCDWPNL